MRGGPDVLEDIKSPADIKGLSKKQTEELACEIRRTVIRTVSENGGHLASNLGMVEATLALHKVFDSPSDSIIFDVGHQCYTHKLLTGRYDGFGTLRKLGGISGFTNPAESKHDKLLEGHSGTSVSAALGIAAANKLGKNGRFAVAVVGDGSLTNGMIYEALNNCADKELDLVILINDNGMSISKNVGGLHKYMARIRTSNGYFTFKRRFEHLLSAIPLVGRPLARFLKLIKDAIKRMFIRDTIFEDLGLVYLGPVNGHDTEKLVRVLTEAKSKHRCCVVHMLTEKGHGYAPARNAPERYHSVGRFEVETGVSEKHSADSYSECVGGLLCDIAGRDERVCAITAAMCDGTGLSRFAREFPERFFDVGIAEEHAVTFASGLSAAGMRPAVALYSTFAQRVYDQVLHDVAIQGLPMVLLFDRCGIVAGDGITHQGIFDYPMFSSIPGVSIYAPEDRADMELSVKTAFDEPGISIVRYPKGSIPEGCKSHRLYTDDGGYTFVTEGIAGCDAVIISSGRMSGTALSAAKLLGEKYRVGVIKLVRVFPLDGAHLTERLGQTRLVYILDEGVRSGGMGEKIAALIAGGDICPSVRIKSLPELIPHGELDELVEMCGFAPEKIADEITALLG